MGLKLDAQYMTMLVKQFLMTQVFQLSVVFSLLVLDVYQLQVVF